MKKILLVALMAIMSIGLISAREKKTENLKTVVFATDIHCEGCSNKIMNNVPSLGKGIKDVQVNLEDKTVTITFDVNKNSEERIIKGFKSLNVEAKPIVTEAKSECDSPCCGENNSAPSKDCCKQK